MPRAYETCPASEGTLAIDMKGSQVVKAVGEMCCRGQQLLEVDAEWKGSESRVQIQEAL